MSADVKKSVVATGCKRESDRGTAARCWIKYEFTQILASTLTDAKLERDGGARIGRAALQEWHMSVITAKTLLSIRQPTTTCWILIPILIHVLCDPLPILQHVLDARPALVEHPPAGFWAVAAALSMITNYNVWAIAARFLTLNWWLRECWCKRGGPGCRP